MKKLSFWQRLNAARLGMILLLFAAAGLTWWVHNAQSRADHERERLAARRSEIRLALVEFSDALRGQLLDPASEGEKRRLADAEQKLETTLADLDAELAGKTEARRALKSLSEFVTGKMVPHKRTMLETARTDPAGAATYYAQTYMPLQPQQRRLVDDLKEEFQHLTDASTERARTVAFLGVIGLVLILVASLLLGWLVSASVNAPLRLLIDYLNRLRSGDFTRRLPQDGHDEFGKIGEGMNRLADDLSTLVGQVQRSGIQVNTTATQISATAKQQQSTANEIAATTAEIGATSKEISATSQELVKTMSEVSEVADDTAELAGSGQEAITRMGATMHQIMNASSTITAKLAVLNEKTANINSVVTTINKVADQTNLLSLNAAIEAEKAGEYGLGFAVVAMEIRRLADQTAVATYDIDKTVKEMQSAVSSGVMGMDKFAEEVRRGVEEIRQVSALLGRIIQEVQALNPRFQTVNEGMQSQATGAQQICETLIQLSEAAHQTADSLQQSNQAIEQLNDAARGLQISVARFKLHG